MRTLSTTSLALLALLTALTWIAGCRGTWSGYPCAERRAKVYRLTTCGSPAPAHGGTTTPNGEPADAMFFKNYGTNPFIDADVDRLSTFAVDVDTASYTVARRYLSGGNLPPEAAVRAEEFINYFDYLYEPPSTETFAIHCEGTPSPFRKECILLRVGLKAREVRPEHRKPAILTFVVDVSGSMGRENRLGLVKRTLALLVGQLREGDRIGIVAYGSKAFRVLDHTGVEDREEILEAIDNLRTGGATNAEEGLWLAYRCARSAYREGSINRVVLCSDGVANVGRTKAEDILARIRGFAREGITLTTVGFGMGNYNDVMMEQLGDKGNGHYAYVDTFFEARRIFQQNLEGTLQVVARDVKVQLEFDPAIVRSYRLLGYENRDVADKDFRNDAIDGGEVGAGHAVTALYQIRLWKGKAGRLAKIGLRFRHPDSDAVEEVTDEFWTSEMVDAFGRSSLALQLAATAGHFAEVLRKSIWARGVVRLADLEKRARALSSAFDERKDVVELARLIAKAHALQPEKEGSPTEEDVSRKAKDGRPGEDF